MKTIIRNFLSILRRFKTATVLNILGLSVAFMAFMVIFMQLDYDYNFDKMHHNWDRIYRVELTWDSQAQAIISRPLADVIIQSSPHIVAGAISSSFGGEMFFSVENNGNRHTFEESIIRVYPSYMDVFEFDLLEGSGKALEDPEKILIPFSLSQKMFGQVSAVNKVIHTEFQNYTIGGVYKDFPKNSIVKNGIYLSIPANENINSWGNSNYELYIRVDQPENSIHLIDNFRRNFDWNTLNENYKWVGDAGQRLTNINDIHFINDATYDFAPKTSKQTLLVLLGIAFVIILIGGINFTNFSTALTPMRIKSINTQKVLGENEHRIRLSLVIEAMIICFISFLIALGFVHLLQFTPAVHLIDADISILIHPYIVISTLVIALVTGLLAGLYPSYYMTSFPPALVLKGGFGLSPKGKQLRSILIGIQFMASFALIIGASFMYLQNYYMQNSSLGYDKDELIVTNINRTINKNRDAFSNQIQSFAGIDGVTYSENLLSSQDQYMGWGRKFRDKDIVFQCLPVNASFLEVIGIDVLEGRNFREEDQLTKNGVFIFNQRARHDFALELDEEIEGIKIIGFMPDVKFSSFRTETTPMAFYVWGTENWGNQPQYAYVKVKAGSDLRTAMKHVQETLISFDSEYPFDIRFYNSVLNSTYEKERRLSAQITLFSLIAIFISIVGVFGLVVFESEYRKKEIGVRKVLGSTTQEILILFNTSYFRIVFFCFVFAAPVAYYSISRWLENFAYKTPIYWWVFILAFLIVLVITSITVTFQSWRVANANPVDSIKTE
ncbi:ABC transporter permease [Parabacteroides sp. PF5-9]|uniref:ABC transporter permease n=1 Tax=Parabacteroides sp. PF5-9 TaxID=1742404 RepID=UPI002475B39E|nr:ABC transporter permease [Parabacteroides sp. PF5-9]MDH6356471.1 putative ABC transport system permease protein [Parabacteroides sp. PF5-9]